MASYIVASVKNDVRRIFLNSQLRITDTVGLFKTLEDLGPSYLKTRTSKTSTYNDIKQFVRTST